MQIRLSFEHGAILDGLPGWREVFALPFDERIAAFSDPGARRRLDAGAESEEAGILRHLAVWDRLIFDETFAPENAGSRAARSGNSRRSAAPPRSTRCSTSSWRTGCAQGCGHRSPPRRRTGRSGRRSAKPPRHRRRIRRWGRHLDTMCGAIYSTSLLGDGVRARGLLSWEQAVRLLTDVPARLYGLRDRGRLVPAPSPTSWCSTRPASGTDRSGRATTCPVAPAGSTPRRPASATSS